MKLSKHHCGFSLVELAIVLVIIGLLMAAFLTPLSIQKDLKDYEKAKLDLEFIKEALYGFAIVNGKLPCPDNNQDGVADENCTGNISNGDLPWVTLGVEESDPWNRPYRYSVSVGAAGISDFTNQTNKFNLNTKGIINIFSDTAKTKKIGKEIPAIIFSLGKNGTTLPPISIEEQENTNLDDNFISHELTTTFDDSVVWISTNVLFNRMVTAQKLP